MVLVATCVTTVLLIGIARFCYLKYADLSNPYLEVLNNFIVAFIFGMCGLTIHLLHDNFSTRYLLLVMVLVFIVIFILDFFIRSFISRTK